MQLLNISLENLHSFSLKVSRTEQGRQQTRWGKEVTEHDIHSCFVDTSVTDDHNETLAAHQICKAEHPEGLGDRR